MDERTAVDVKVRYEIWTEWNN